ncbi:hypothetical protein GCK72_004017 [Caenorhabditis remanei]|uniref:Uncharacterized protein n=1 Tax=Caenorhabditis remanei TaxID=31234 RepID=A0A6A5HB16_CAERE|nr:hypothetical protein GCK72_004017 [Caenorhabditis remanei]KAF1764071.1 hypothetical protein GCK72_004017 [Caenorhabditis remanei]
MSTVVKRSVGRPRKHPIQSPESPEVSAHNSPEVTIVESSCTPPSSRKLLKPRIARDATTRRVKRNMDLRDKNNRIKFRSSLLSKKDRAWRDSSWETDDDEHEGAESTEEESKENEPTQEEKIRK